MVKSSPVSFRFGEDLLEQLTKESRKADLPMNSFVERALRRYLGYISLVEKLDMVTINKGTLTFILQKLTDDEVVECARDSAERFYESVSFLDGEYTAKGVLRLFVRGFKDGGWATVEFVNEGRAFNFRIKHSVGMKWSLYVSTLMEEMLKRAGLTVEMKRSAGLVTLKIPSDVVMDI